MSINALLLRPGKGAEYSDQPVRLCVWGAEYCDQLVCLSPSIYLWNRWTDLHKIVCADPLWQCDFRFGLFFRFSFRFASYFLVLVSFQFYSIGDFYKYVMTYITSHQHILLNGVLYAGTFVECQVLLFWHFRFRFR